jgi:tetratricopeptide (TPR) repeat protein/predicted aspartyl protease
MRFRFPVSIVALVMLLALGAVSADAPPDSAAGEIQLQLGDLLFAETRYEEALRAYERAAKVSGDTPLEIRARTGVVRCALRIAEFGTAMREATELRDLAARDSEAVALFGDAVWSAGQFDQAEEAFIEAVKLNPESARARHGMARVLATRNDLDGAMNEAQTALRYAPRDGEIHHTVGFIFERMHRFEDAALAFSNYVNLLPNKDRSEKAAWARSEIRFLRSFGQRVPFQVDGDNPQMLHTVDFRLERDKVIVRASLNEGAEIDLVLDTGAEQTVLSRRAAQRAGVTPVVYTLSAGVGDIGLRGLQVGRLDSIQIGTLKVRNIPCLVKNPALGGLPTREADSFSPLALGLSMTIDYEKRQLTIGRKLAPEEADSELPMRIHRLAMVRGTLNKNQPAHFVVDTGGEVISISSSTADTLDAYNGRRIPLKVYGTSGWDRDAFLLPGVDLEFDKIHFANFPVVVLNLRAPSALLGFQVGGIVGHRFLSKYRVGVDLERSVLRLKRLDGMAAD